MAMNHEQDIRQLNSFLRGEIAAVETYDQAIDKLADEPALGQTLGTCRNSHQRRVELLKDEIERLGGNPIDSGGAWSGFARLVEGGAKLLGKRSAIGALEEGEDQGRDDYQDHLKDLSPDVRDLVRGTLLPEQLRTHETLSALKHRM
jgi:demethoxyubiquinone hydroxylase (CLK1/Coq7/Cat5 family)